MLGFEHDFWDYATFATVALAGFASVMTYIWAPHPRPVRDDSLRGPRDG